MARPEPSFSAEPLADGLRRIWACNPLYLVSGALLLYSFYLVSADKYFLTTEISQLWFNLASLQLYEAVVVATSIFLARRAVWYDSTLLAGLENLLALVPFILISQAALINMHLVWVLCGAAGLLAAVRFGLLRRLIARLNVPPKMLAVGAGLLVVNVALPVVYRILHESKFGTKPDWGAAYETNQYVWWFLVPAVCALANLVPWKRSSGELWPERGWLPAGFFSLWLVGTGVHLYCLDYVYDFDLRSDLLAPAIWALAWTLSFRLMRSLPGVSAGWASAAWVVPAAATLFATGQPGKQVFLALTAVNLVIYGALYLRCRSTLALHLGLISLLALIAALPESWGRSLVAEYSREKFIFGAGAVYLLGCIAVSRDAKLGVLGSMWAGIVAGVVAPETNALHWGFEAALAFLLMHSLRWTESRAEGTALVRWVAAGVWVGHAIIWSHLYGGGWRACAIAVPVLAIYFVFRWLQGHWGPLAVIVAAVLVLLAAPGHLAAVHVQSTPAGVLAVVGSFVLFGLGTFAALAKSRRPERF